MRGLGSVSSRMNVGREGKGLIARLGWEDQVGGEQCAGRPEGCVGSVVEQGAGQVEALPQVTGWHRRAGCE